MIFFLSKPLICKIKSRVEKIKIIVCFFTFPKLNKSNKKFPMDQIFDPPYTVFACVHEWSCPDMSPRSRSMKDTARSRALQHYSQKNEFHLLLHTVNFSAQSAGDTLHYTTL